MYTPKQILEWHFNKSLNFFFTGNREFMLIFQDNDLHRYYFVHSYYPEKETQVRLVSKKTIRAQDFRPDAVLLDRQGQLYLVESKLKINSQREFESLVYQTLLYINLIITPAYDGVPTVSTYSFLDLLYKAHWFYQEYEGGYTNLIEKHQWYFDLPIPLGEGDFEDKMPRVIFFLPTNAKEDRLISALEVMHNRPVFTDYKQYVISRNLDKKDRVDELSANWNNLQKVKFSRTSINPALLQPLVWTKVDLS